MNSSVEADGFKFVFDSLNFVFEKIRKVFRKISQKKDCWKRRWLFVSKQLVSHIEQLLHDRPVDLATVIGSFDFVDFGDIFLQSYTVACELST